MRRFREVEEAFAFLGGLGAEVPQRIATELSGLVEVARAAVFASAKLPGAGAAPLARVCAVLDELRRGIETHVDPDGGVAAPAWDWVPTDGFLGSGEQEMYQSLLRRLTAARRCALGVTRAPAERLNEVGRTSDAEEARLRTQEARARVAATDALALAAKGAGPGDGQGWRLGPADQSSG